MGSSGDGLACPSMEHTKNVLSLCIKDNNEPLRKSPLRGAPPRRSRVGEKLDTGFGERFASRRGYSAWLYAQGYSKQGT